jgi:hypothetical protein
VRCFAAMPLPYPASPPRLYADAALPHHHMIGHPAAALGAAEAQILQRLVAVARIDDRLQVRGAAVKARLAPHEQAQPSVLGQRVAGGREVVGYRVRCVGIKLVSRFANKVTASAPQNAPRAEAKKSKMEGCRPGENCCRYSRMPA